MSFIQTGEVDWERGSTEVAIASVALCVFIGLPMLLGTPEILSMPAVVFYILLFMIGFFGHVDDLTEEQFRKAKWADFLEAIALGLFGFLVIQVLFLVGLSLLATGETTFVMNKWQLLAFNLTFVIAGEELVFRDSLPYLLSRAFNYAMPEILSVAIAFTVSSIAFGTLHIWTYGFNVVAVVKAILAGVILSVIRIFGGLLASYVAHMFYNSVNIIGLFTFPLV